MHNTFLVDEDLSTVCAADVETLIGYLDDLETINSEIENLLTDEGWTGDAHDKCVGAIGMMERYRSDLSSMCETLKQNLESVVNDAGDFVNNSDKVASVRTV